MTTTPTTSSAAACTGSQLSGTFAVVPDSHGAGQVAYLLTLTNTSLGSCFVFGLPQAQLLEADGSGLPTHIAAADSLHLGARIVLARGVSAVAQARFSPSVPGTGDSQSGACQPKAATLRVTPDGGGSVDVPIRPPTSVCERGTLNFDVFAPAP